MGAGAGTARLSAVTEVSRGGTVQTPLDAVLIVPKHPGEPRSDETATVGTVSIRVPIPLPVGRRIVHHRSGWYWSFHPLLSPG